MNNKLTLLSFSLVSALLFGCADSESPFTENGNVSSGTNIISDTNFIIAFDDTAPAVLDLVENTFDASVTVAVTFSASDKLRLRTTGATAYIDVDWGTLSDTSCIIDSTGQCSITWGSNAKASEIPPDNQITFTGWIIGEESFTDLNGNIVFDDGDIFLDDVSGPFLDLDHSGDFTAGDKVLSPGNSNGVLTPADGLYNGADCAHTSLCSTTTQIYVSARAILSIAPAP